MGHYRLTATVMLISALLISCAETSNPLSAPSSPSALTADMHPDRVSQTHLWGFYEVYIDTAEETAIAVIDRQAMFSANVVNFLNGKPANLSFHINNTTVEPGYIDVDIDVTLTHPFPGLTQYNGYDVRGVFMGNGSAYMDYNPDLVYPVFGTDQFMFPDPDLPDTDNGAPDGYTRWFNFSEFSNGGMPLFQYTQGKNASPGFNGTATLNPYKYFADYLSDDDDLWEWLNDPSSQNPISVFSAGQANTRNYYLRFPTPPGVRFGYAVVASWGGAEPDFHPTNADEAIGVDVVDTSNVYYKDPSINGGNIILDISVWAWNAQLTGGVMEDYRIYIESTVLGNVYQATTTDMTPVGGDENYSTYHVEIPADNVGGTNGNEFWVIVECSDADYSNEFGAQNDAWDDPLAAFFRYDLDVTSAVPPVAIAEIETNPPYNSCQSIHFIDAGSYDPDGTIDLYDWDWDNDGVYDEEGPDVWHTFDMDGIYLVQFRVTDNDGLTDTLDQPLEVEVEGSGGWAKTWGGAFVGPDYSSDQGRSCVVDSTGSVYVTGQFQGGNVDFDPDPTESDPHSSVGGLDCFLSKFDSCGSLIWAVTWGGTSDDAAWGVDTDGSDNVVVHGTFRGSVDFDPGAGNDTHNSNGEGDSFISKFDSDGVLLWATTWGCTSYDNPYSIATGPNDTIYVADEWFYGPIDLDPDPSLSDIHPLIGSSDRYLSKFDSDGDYLWGKSWGGSLWDGGAGVAVDSDGYAYVGGHYRGVVDFDPDPIDTDYITCINYPVASAVVSKFDGTGDYEWAKLLAGTAASNPNGVCLNGDADTVYISGTYSGTNADFDPGTGVDNHSTNGLDDVFLTVFSSNGAFQWARTWGGTNNDQGWYIASDGSDYVMACGRFSSVNADFDPSSGTDNHSSSGDYDCFVSEFDLSGTFVWADTWGGIGTESVLGLEAVSSGGIYCAGYFGDIVDFNPGAGADNHTSSGTTDAFLTRFGLDGEW